MRRLEAFLDEALRPGLDAVLAQRDVARAAGARCQQLRVLLKEVALAAKGSAAGDSAAAMGAAVAPVVVLADVGCHNFVQAELVDPSTVYVNIGAGVVAPLTHAEAFAFLAKKERLLAQEQDRATREALRVKYRIRLVMEAIARLHESSLAVTARANHQREH